jgi:nitroimidazol reductase NimA-like FMN-containing flavoprotein (pyridoxamine 5'-phosphate oxidase superfamily)
MVYHLKRKEQKIANVDALKRVLGSTQYVTIALCKNDEPYLVTLSHGYDPERNCIYFHCAPEGKKLDYIRANNKVYGQAMIDEGFVEGECKQSYTSVQFSGKVIFPQSVDEKLEALTCMIEQLNKNLDKMLTQINKLNAETDLKNLIIGRIDIQYLSGKHSKRDV